MNLGVAALAVACVAALIYVYLRDHRRVIAARQRIFEQCHNLLDDAEYLQDGAYYPLIRGTRDGRPIELKLIADHINIRKLPTLWLLVSLREDMPVQATFDAMNRPRNTEFFSIHGELENTLATPPDWPDTTIIRCDQPDKVARLLDPLTDQGRYFTQDPQAKELFVNPHGVRLTYLAAEGIESHYMLLRQAMFANEPLDRDLVDGLINRVLHIADKVKASDR